MDNNLFIVKNTPIPTAVQPVIDKMTSDGEVVLFVIVGDLTLKGKYGETALIFTKDAVVSYDGYEGSEKRYLFSDMKDAEAKRMYGNATLSAVMPDGRREVFFRYTYAVASLCDAAALFINHINEGADLNTENAIMAVTFERVLSVCPKCGRTLLHPGAECIMCRSKVKVVKKLAKYITPQLKTIIFCIVLSLITKALSLVPPTVTGFIVDVVITEGGSSNVAILNKISELVGHDAGRLLLSMIACLLFTYIFQHGIGIVRSYLMRAVGDKAVSALRNDIY